MPAEIATAFIVIFLMLSAVFLAPDPVKLGRKLARRKHKAEVEPWGEWRAIKTKLDASRKAEHDEWQGQFDGLVQATCVHSYPATGSSPTYYTCVKCRYQEPWEYRDGCDCHYETITTLSSPYPEYNVTHRHGNCVWHGVDWENFNRRTDRTDKPFKRVTLPRRHHEVA